MLGFEIRMRHDDDRRSGERLIIFRYLACDQYAITDLEILQLNWRGILQILFAGSDADDAGCRLHRDCAVRTGIGSECDRRSVDGS